MDRSWLASGHCAYPTALHYSTGIRLVAATLTVADRAVPLRLTEPRVAGQEDDDVDAAADDQEKVEEEEEYENSTAAGSSCNDPLFTTTSLDLNDSPLLNSGRAANSIDHRLVAEKLVRAPRSRRVSASSGGRLPDGRPRETHRHNLPSDDLQRRKESGFTDLFPGSRGAICHILLTAAQEQTRFLFQPADVGRQTRCRATKPGHS
ncbi:hypothetical protein Q5P01_017138 [Channa striata]|uniref:Uncharacterized protein n=1 Tax=Channa striata TaxID=64152 RepID=A0AA88MAA0_CHASR|nr:hypothetical protein Q5P01_017138 [Channa striata]